MKTLGDRVRGAQVRITIHLAFTIFLVVAVLLPYLTIRTHKERAEADQAKHREVTEQRMVERLQSAAGQLALENPSRILLPAVPLRPVILPFAEIQADMPGVVLDQVRAVGCPIQFKAAANAVLEQGSVCVGLRKSDAAEVRGRLLVTGTFLSANLVPHLFLEAKADGAGRTVAKRFQDAHRIEITLNEGKSSYQWVLPVQVRIDRRTHRVREDLGLTAYRKDARGLPVTARPDFVGAWFTEGDCIDPEEPAASCMREHAFSIAIPRDRWGRQGGTVKPGDLTLDVVISGPDASGKPSTILNSSAAKTAFTPFGRGDLAGYLAPGESLTVTRQLSGSTQELFVLDRDASPKPPGFQTFGERVLGLFGMDLADPVAVSEQRRSFGVRGGSFDMIYRSSPRGLDAELLSSGAAVTAYAVPMIFLALLAWVTIEHGVLRRVMRLTGRTRLVSLAIRANGNLNQFDFSALKGRDELGVLATGLDDLLKRIADDVQRNAIRLHHERSMLRAIGHEIRAPLQSLSAVLATSEAGTRRP